MKETLVQRKGLMSWTNRDLLVAAVLSVVVGLILVPLLFFFHSLMGPMGPLGMALTTGLWVIPGIMVPYIIRRPGAAFLGSVLIGLIEGPFSPFGWIILFLQIAVGIFCEVPFFLTRYRNYSFLFLLCVGGFGNLGPLAVQYLFYGYLQLNLAIQVVAAVGHIVGGILGALIAILLTNALAKTGVLNSFAIGREKGVEV